MLADQNLVNTIPDCCAGAQISSQPQVEVVVFELDPHSFVDGYISEESVRLEYELRGLAPADICVMATLNNTFPQLDNGFQNATHWKLPSGKWGSMHYYRYKGKSHACVDKSSGWDDDWWFVGVRK